MEPVVIITFLFILLIIIILVNLSTKHEYHKEIFSSLQPDIKSSKQSNMKPITCPKCDHPAKEEFENRKESIIHYYCDNRHVFHTMKYKSDRLSSIGLSRKSGASVASRIIHSYYRENKDFNDKIKKLQDEVKGKTIQKYEMLTALACVNGMCPICRQKYTAVTDIYPIEYNTYQCKNHHQWHFVTNYPELGINYSYPIPDECRLGNPLYVQIHQNAIDAEINLITPKLIKKLQDGNIPAIDEIFPQLVQKSSQ